MENPENGERIISSHTVHSEVTEDGEVITRHRQIYSVKRNGIHGEPVMLDKHVEDKRSRTKIPVSRFRQMVEKVKAERRGSKQKKEHESHIPVRRSIPKPVKEHKHPSDTIKKEITNVKTEINMELSEPVITKTVTIESSEPTFIKTEIADETTEPEDEFDKIYAEIVTEDTSIEEILDDSLLSPKIEDPEKLEIKFEEIIHDYDEHKVEPINVEVVRRSKIPYLKRMSQQDVELSAQTERTNKIIAARDKLRLRNSLTKSGDFEDELDIELKNSLTDFDVDTANKSNENVSPTTDTTTEKEIKHEVIDSPNSTTEITSISTRTVSTSSFKENESVASSSVVETTTVEEVTTSNINDKKEEKLQHITEENIVKNSIKIGIPVFNSYTSTHEFSENNETLKTVEVKRVLSYTSNDEELSIENKVSRSGDETQETNIESVDNNIENQTLKAKDVEVDATDSENNNDKSEKLIDTDKTNTKDQNQVKAKELSADNEIQLRGKVERLTSKTDSKELIETDVNKRESINELTKKKSVLSKIAMFEKKETEEPIATRAPRRELKLPKLIAKDWQNVERVHIHTPLIVEEVFKPFKSNKTEQSHEVKKEENPSKNDSEFTIVRAERITLQSPDSVHYAAENKIQIETVTVKENKVVEEAIPVLNNTDPEYTGQKVEFATITDVQPTKRSITNDLPSPSKDLDKHEIRDFPNKIGITTSITNDLPSPSKDLDKHEIRDFPNKTGITSITNDLPSPRNYLDKQEIRDFSNKIGITTSITNNLPSPSKDLDKHEIKYFPNKTGSTTKLNTTKELQPPVTIPGFKPVSELLRSFESKKDGNRSFTKRTVSKVDHFSTVIETPVKLPQTNNENIASATRISYTETYNNESYDNFETVHDYKSLDDVFAKEIDSNKLKLRKEDEMRRAKSLAELDLGDAVKGKVNNIIFRMKSVDRMELDRKEIINKKEMPRKRSVSEKIALFEGKLTPSRSESPLPLRIFKSDKPAEAPRTVQKTENIQSRTETNNYTRDSQRERSVIENTEKKVVETEKGGKNDEEVIQKKIEELRNAKTRYGKVDNMPGIELSNGITMPVLAVGTALLHPQLIYHIVTAAIDLGYRTIDSAFIYGNEKEVGEAIRDKIADGTVKREELFIISKLWSTYHRTDLVEGACRASLKAMGLDYFDLYLIHNPMSFKEGGAPIPKIATVIQYSEHDYLDAWYGMEKLVTKGLVRAIGVSNFNSVQLQRVLDKGRVKPVVNQVECHPYLSQQRLDLFCTERNVALSCFGVLGSKGTPAELKNGQPAVIDDALVQVMASGLGVTPAQLLISYQLENGHGVVVKASSAAHLWDNLLSLNVNLTMVQVDALHALNRNKRMFTFKGMGDTHKNYPFNIAF